MPDEVDILPFPNWTIFALMNWMWKGSKEKSHAEVDLLVRSVLLDPKFEASDLQKFSASRETRRFDQELTSAKDGWKESDVIIQVPDGLSHKLANDPPITTFLVPGLHHRSLVEVIRSIWLDKSSMGFHYTPFKLLWRRQSGEVERLYGELYTTDAYIDAQESLRTSPTEPGCTLECIICALMFWSDSTHLASFGNAALWPLYLFFRNQSKYECCKPTSGACHHVAYIPKVCLSFFIDYLA